MALMQQIAGVSVDETGRLVEDPGFVGAGSSLNVPPTAIQLPAGYPAGLPSPFIDNGKIRFTRVPPNFNPTVEQIAWMMVALQLWVFTYSTTPYNVFTYNSYYDGSGLSIADFTIRYCRYFRNPENYNPATGEYGIWNTVQGGGGKGVVSPTTTTWVPMVNTGMATKFWANYPGAIWGHEAEMLDFGSPPAPVQHSWIDDVGTVARVGMTLVLSYVAKIIPVVGPMFANAYYKAMNQDAVDEANLQGGIQQVVKNEILPAQQAAKAAAAKTRLKQALIGAGLALALWLAYDND